MSGFVQPYNVGRLREGGGPSLPPDPALVSFFLSFFRMERRFELCKHEIEEDAKIERLRFFNRRHHSCYVL